MGAEAGGWQKISSLQYHRIEDIFKKVEHLIDTYAEDEIEDGDDEIDEDMNQQGVGEFNQGFYNNQNQQQHNTQLGQQPEQMQQFSFNDNHVNNMQMPPPPPEGGNRYNF